MTGWRYIAQTLNGDGTADFLNFDVPLSGVEIEDQLSGPGGLSGSISPEFTRLKGSDGLPIFREWSTAIFAENQGVIHGGGILTHSNFNGAEWELECVGFTGYAKDMPYTGNGAHFVQTDTLDIYRFIWSHIQSQQGGNIGLEFAETKSGVKVGSELASEEYDPEGGDGGLTLQSQAYKLAWYQDHDLDSNLADLAEQTPFDYHERHWWDGDVIRHRVDFGVPTIGRRRSELRFTIGENVFVKPDVEYPGEDYADEVFMLGAGEGSKMVRGHARGSRTRLRRVTTLSDPSIRTLSKANTAARAELQWRYRLQDFSSISVRDHRHAPIGSVQVGDEIRVNGPTGWVHVDGWFRVLGRTIRPEDPSAMELEIVRTDRIAS